MKNIYCLLFVFFISQLLIGQEEIEIQPTPSWVEFQSYDENPPVNSDEIAEGILSLLVDYQINIPKEASYFRLVEKITENVGIQSASQINISYDPLYQKLFFHEINIIRAGEIIKKLNPREFQVLRRELNAENYLYDGSLSAMTNLTDVRTNDIIDVSYTIVGFNPIHGGKYSEVFYLNDNVPLGKLNISIYAKKPVPYKLVHSELKPRIDTNNGSYTYQWTDINPARTIYEVATPIWQITHPTLIVSEYNSWSEVINWGVNVFRVYEKPSSDLEEKIESIEKQYKTEGEKIKAVLNFVQNEIRYLGLEYGIGNYKPNNPNKVFSQRYGDCKDKSLLMATMLRKLNIEAYPMLVNTNLKETINELLPSSEFFDHCVVKVVDSANYELYYDPTSSNQGGQFRNVHFPNYEYGLVLKQGNTSFDQITSFFSNKVTTNEEYLLEDVGKGATYTIETIYQDVEADRMRNYFKNNSLESISKEYENYYSNYFFNIKSLKKPDFNDDVEKNLFTTYEKYYIDSLWRPMEMKEDYISASFLPSTLLDILYVPTSNERQNKINVPFPVSRQHNIKVKLPEVWNIEDDKDIISSDVFYFDSNIDYNRPKRELSLQYYLKTQKKFIDPSEFTEYTKHINELDQVIGYMIYYPKKSITKERITSGGNFSLIKFVLAVFFCALLLGVVLWLLAKYVF